MTSNKSKAVKKQIAFLIMVVLLILAIVLEVDAFYTLLMVSFIAILALYREWDDYRTYKEQPYWNKFWLRCLAIMAAGVFFSTLVMIIGVVFGLYEL